MARTANKVSQSLSTMRAVLRSNRAQLRKAEAALTTYKGTIKAAIARIEKVSRVGGDSLTVSSVRAEMYCDDMEFRATAYITDASAIMTPEVKKIRGALLLAGYEVSDMETRASEYSATGEFKATRNAPGWQETFTVTIYLADNATCTKVQTGVKETPIYEVRCA